MVAAILDDDLEAARRAQPVDRRRLEDVDHALRDMSPEACLQVGGDGVAGQVPARARSSKVVEHDVHGAEVGRVGVQQDRWPGDGDGVLDARASAGRSPRSGRITSPRPLERRGIGQLHVDQQIALVLLRE